MEQHFKYLDKVHKAQINDHKKRIKELEQIIQNQNKTITEIKNRSLVNRILNR